MIAFTKFCRESMHTAMLNACTIVAANYVPYASVLVDSFFAHHPDGSFTVLVIDDEEADVQGLEPRARTLRLADIGLNVDETHRLAAIYEVTELSTAIKPWLLRYLLAEGAETVLYFDPDILIFRSVDTLAQLAAAHDVVLTPHTTVPIPRDDRGVDPFFILAAGVYNLGFAGVSGSAGPFLDWWWQSTRRDALIDVRNMMFTDQRWIDFVPGMFDACILKDPTYNVAYWNLHGRTVTHNGNAYLVNGAPLHFFHFSGYDIRTPWLLSKHQGSTPRVLLSDHPTLDRLCREYRDRLYAAGFDPAGGRSYGWSTAASGVLMTTRIRRIFRQAVIAADRGDRDYPPDPFDRTNPDEFINWLNSPAENGPRRISRYLLSLYNDRSDLQNAFPNLHGSDAVAYAHWCTQDGVTQEGIPDPLVPRTDLIDAQLAPSPPTSEGLNIAGYFRAELGIGEAARRLVETVEVAGIPHSTATYDGTVSRQEHPFDDRGAAAAYDINIVCVNADMTPRFAADVGPRFFAGRYTVGYWFWEVEQFPLSMTRSFDFVDEVWAATDYVAAAIRAAGRKPVFTVPLPITPPVIAEGVTRDSLRLPQAFMFLFMFDFLSIVERKNPLGLIEAFTRAFAPGEGPVLVLKSINGHIRLGELERVRSAIGERQDILLIDGYYSAAQKNALIGLCDCYVSLHRSEGFGLTMAEALALGKPVVATGYSGNLHFMTRENSYLVDYVSVPIPAGCDPYPVTGTWADPDLHQAADRLREVYERPDIAAAKAQRGREDVLTRHDTYTSAKALLRRVEEIRASRHVVVTLPPQPPEDIQPIQVTVSSSAVEAVENLLPHLVERSAPTLSAEGRPLPGIRVAAQRALFRLLRPYWFQRVQFDSHLISALRQICAELGSLRQSQQSVAAQVSHEVRAVSEASANQWREASGRIDGVRAALDTAQLAVSLLSRERAKVPLLAGDLAEVQRRMQVLGTTALQTENALSELEQAVARASEHAALADRVSRVEQTLTTSNEEASRLLTRLRSTIAELQTVRAAAADEVEQLKQKVREQEAASQEGLDASATDRISDAPYVADAPRRDR
jgi:glycosyltransferase involved in cell wall biosynthesis